jgi:hypothetical protein
MEHPIVVRGRRNPLQVRQLLERFDQSGLSAVEFAQNEGLHMSTFYRQLRRRSRRPADALSLANQPPKVSFVEVDTTTSLALKKTKTPPRHPLSPPNSAYRISLRADAVLEIPSGFHTREAEFLLRVAANIFFK